MATLKTKLSEFIKGFRTDAVPRQPRPVNVDFDHQVPPEAPVDDEHADSSEHEEVIIEEENDSDMKKKSKPKSFFKPKIPKKSSKKPDPNNHKGSINTQAAGNVLNVVGCTNVRWGNDYFMGTTYIGSKNAKKEETCDDSDPEEEIVKTNLIKTVMKATIKPEDEHLDYISKNMGKTWRKFFRKLGFTEGRIDTFEHDNKIYGVQEVRYKLLLEWMQKKNDATLGKLATLLWEHGEKCVVKELADLYSEKN